MRLTEYKKAAAILGVFVIVLIIAGLLLKGGGKPDQVKSEIQSWIAAVGKPISQVTGGIRSGFGGIFQFKDNLREKESLWEEVKRLQKENADLKLTRSEYEELQALSKVFSYDTVQYGEVQAANVIASSSSRWMYSFTIDQGEKSGIQPGAAVLSGDCLIGRVVEVSKNSAKAISLLDEGSKVSFHAEKDQEILGMIEGNGKGGISGYLLGDKGSIQEGDRLQTSGIGSYPKGFTIGIVTKVHNRSGSERMRFDAEMAVDPRSIRKVAVVL